MLWEGVGVASHNHMWVHDNMTGDTRKDGTPADEWHLLHIHGAPGPNDGCQACVYVDEETGTARLYMHAVFHAEFDDADTAMAAADGILCAKLGITYKEPMLEGSGQ